MYYFKIRPNAVIPTAISSPELPFSLGLSD